MVEKQKKEEALKNLNMIAKSLEKSMKKKVEKIISLTNECEKLINISGNDLKKIKDKLIKNMKGIEEETVLIERRVKTYAPEIGYTPTEPDIQIHEWAGLTINHEINNPLFIVKARVQTINMLLRREKYDINSLKDKLAKIKNETERIAGIIDKFLNAKDVSVIEYQGNELMIDLNKL